MAIDDLAVEDIAAQLHQKNVIAGRSFGANWKSTVNRCIPQASWIKEQKLNPSISDFTPDGLVLKDLDKKTVGFYHAATSNKKLRVETLPFSDILVLTYEKMTLGWVSQDQITVSEEEKCFTVPSQQLRLMPQGNLFAVPCPHLSVYGGIYVDAEQAWLCFNCNELIIAVDTIS